jgi:hypothetical protein
MEWILAGSLIALLLAFGKEGKAEAIGGIALSNKWLHRPKGYSSSDLVAVLIDFDEYHEPVAYFVSIWRVNIAGKERYSIVAEYRMELLPFSMVRTLYGSYPGSSYTEIGQELYVLTTLHGAMRKAEEKRFGLSHSRTHKINWYSGSGLLLKKYESKYGFTANPPTNLY